jgi:tetratricopeptide (TPR) repeat protein
VRGSLTGSVALHLVLIAVLGLVAYSNTFDVPFHFDDKYKIVDNPAIKDLRYFVHPSEAKGFTGFGLYNALKQRYMGYLSFALNYKIHGLEVTGYHITNLAIHILNAVLLYFLVVLTFKSPCMDGSSLKEHSRCVALFTALLFVAHPVQTQAVTYIIQRLASMAAMFYLGALVLYVKWRLNKETKDKNNRSVALSLYFLALLCAALAMLTKQISFTLPIAIALYELMFFEKKKQRLLYLIPFFLTMLIIPLTLTGMDSPLEEMIGDISDKTVIRDTQRLDYLLTEFRVLVTYLRLLVFPATQNLDYDYPVYHSFFDLPVFLSFLLLMALFGLGVFLYRRSRDGERASRLVSFGIFWYFITLSVESSLIPLHLIFEHRVYLPSAGIMIVVVSGVFLLRGHLRSRRAHVATVLLFSAITLILVYATNARNNIWKNSISLWEDVVKKSPQKARGHNNLGNAYDIEGLTDKAMEQYQIALNLEPDYAMAHFNLGTALISQNSTDDAIKHYRIALQLKPDFAEAYYSIGLTYWSKGLTDKAIEYYMKALRLKPYFTKANYFIGIAYWSKGLIDKAIEHYMIALRLEPKNVKVHNNIGSAYSSKGLFKKAIEHYMAALRLEPKNVAVHNNIGSAYVAIGLFDKAVEHYKIALRMKPNYAEGHSNLGAVYMDMGLTEKAIEHYMIALRLNPDVAEAQFNLGVAYWSKGMDDSAIEHYAIASKLKPDFEEAHFALGVAYLKKGNTDKARMEFQTVLKIAPDFHNARRYLEQMAGE